MRPGKMDRRVTIRTMTVTEDDFGEEVQTWSDLATVWAERRDLRGQERWQAQQVMAEASATYWLRYPRGSGWGRSDLGPMSRLYDISDAREYDIHGVSEIGRREKLELVVSGRGE